MSRYGVVTDDEVLTVIRSHISERGYPPTIREIARAVGLHSQSAVFAHLQHLERDGRIQRSPTHSRAIRVLEVA